MPKNDISDPIDGERESGFGTPQGELVAFGRFGKITILPGSRGR